MVSDEILFVSNKLTRQTGETRNRAHVIGKTDGLTDLAAMAGVHRNRRAMLRRGLEAGDLAPEDEAAIEGHRRTGRRKISKITPPVFCNSLAPKKRAEEASMSVVGEIAALVSAVAALIQTLAMLVERGKVGKNTK